MQSPKTPQSPWNQIRRRRRRRMYYCRGPSKEQAGTVPTYTRPMYATVVNVPVAVVARTSQTAEQPSATAPTSDQSPFDRSAWGIIGDRHQKTFVCCEQTEHPSLQVFALWTESLDSSHSSGDHLSVGATHCLIRHRLLAGESTDEVWAYGLPSGVLSRASGSCDPAHGYAPRAEVTWYLYPTKDAAGPVCIPNGTGQGATIPPGCDPPPTRPPTMDSTVGGGYCEVSRPFVFATLSLKRPQTVKVPISWVLPASGCSNTAASLFLFPPGFCLKTMKNRSTDLLATQDLEQSPPNHELSESHYHDIRRRFGVNIALGTQYLIASEWPSISCISTCNFDAKYARSTVCNSKDVGEHVVQGLVLYHWCIYSVFLTHTCRQRCYPIKLPAQDRLNDSQQQFWLDLLRYNYRACPSDPAAVATRYSELFHSFSTQTHGQDYPSYTPPVRSLKPQPSVVPLDLPVTRAIASVAILCSTLL
ncbi:hypothetical protein DFH06DRAFT_1366147 [Mycena polygramma]|nr:hypothetical protein DFH06DRAFT_1366147 [Mycena polygramma]